MTVFYLSLSLFLLNQSATHAFTTRPFTSLPTQTLSSHVSAAVTESSISDDVLLLSSSDRSKLIENAKEVDGSLQQSGQQNGSYAPSGWSNRLGTVLTPVADRIYTADRPFYWNNIDVGGRMTVIQLPNETNNNNKYDLWIHSPIDLDVATRSAIDQLGTVKYVISPNYEHLKWAEQWHKAYPDAYMWGCPGLMERLPNIQWEGEIPTDIGMSSKTTALPDCCWDFDEIVPLHLNFEDNPFTGRPFFNEVIFLHRPTKAVMTTDVYWNYPKSSGTPFPNGAWELAPSVPSIPIGSRLWKFAMDRIYLPFYKNLMVRDKVSYSKMVSTVVDEWEPEVIIPCHGDPIRGKDTVRSMLTQHFS